MSDSAPAFPEKAFVFDLHLVCGGYAYFSTVTGWIKNDDQGREVREPDVVTVEAFQSALDALGQRAVVVDTVSRFDRWLLCRGWAVIARDAAYSLVKPWLKKRSCVTDAIGTFTDIALCDEGALKHYAGRSRRQYVKERDGGVCLLCGNSENDGAELTMQHVMPFSRGGVTTSRNLVVLCKRCNENLGTQHLNRLYDLAGLPHQYDLALFQTEITEEAFAWAAQISSNLLHTRCVVW